MEKWDYKEIKVMMVIKVMVTVIPGSWFLSPPSESPTWSRSLLATTVFNFQ